MEFILFDRIEKINQIVNQYGEEKFYISFSGGKDSTILHYLIDMALPENKIPRVFINTGIEYLDIVKFVKEIKERDDRFVILQPTKNIKDILEKVGYPFKSKQHCKIHTLYKNGSSCEWVKNYLDIEKSSKFKCPKILRYQFSEKFNLKISSKCCDELKKKPIKIWEKFNNKSIAVTGMRKEEGGQRGNINCILIDSEGKIKRFHPLAVVNEKWEDWFVKEYNIELCKLYLSPYNFKRTGCKGCPFALDLQECLTTMQIYLPTERKQCEKIWQPVYEEYRKLGYRLDKTEQLKLF